MKAQTNLGNNKRSTRPSRDAGEMAVTENGMQAEQPAQPANQAPVSSEFIKKLW
ncbi:Uncharacterised protein, partial [Mycoplasmoides gallisepticum]